MNAVPLIFGAWSPPTTRTPSPADPRIDALREKMECVEDARFTKEYLDADKRSIANGASPSEIQRRQQAG